MGISFTHLHCHSNFSLLDGVSTIEAIVEKAVNLGMKHLALTDHNNLYGSVVFYEKSKEKGIHPIIGSEITLSDGNSTILLVKNNDGYANLCNIITEGNLNGKHSGFIINEKSIFKRHSGLIALSGGKKGRITKFIKAKNTEKAIEECRKWKSIFKEDFYIEIQYYEPADKLLNYKLRDISFNMQVPLVCSNDVHFVSKSEHSLRKVLKAINENTSISRLKLDGSEEQYMKSPKEMIEMFSRFPEVIKNTQVISQKCEFEYSLNKSVFPKIEIQKGASPFSILKKMCYDGLKKLYPVITDEIKSRLDYELETIDSLGYTEYFLIVKDIVDYAKNEGIPCVGRGSAGDSIVSYTLGITQIDPIKYDLYFERFLNPQRSEPPDIDIDLCWKKRDEVINYIYKKYGNNKTAMICTFNTFGMRSSIGDVGKAYGISEEEVRNLTKTLPHWKIEKLDESLEKIPECKNIQLKTDVYRSIISDCKKISGFPRHLSIHPGGVIIAPDNITNYTPLEESRKGIIISQHDMYSVAKLGLVKMDFLGVRSLSVISDCIKSVGKNNLLDIPMGDSETLMMIRNGNTIGCFQLESPAMRGLLKKMTIQNLDDIIVAVALIRPGPSEGGMKDLYIKRRAGIEPVEYLHPSLEPILKDTCGIIVYQEQVLQIANKLAGLSYGEADILRRAMTKSRNKDELKSLGEKFINGAKKKGLTEEEANDMWSLLCNFVGYGFNKAHSATYGLIAYQSAYLKRYYPVEYLTAVINNCGGFYSRAEYIEECRRIGIKINPPDVNMAEIEFTYIGNKIITGLSAISELTQKSMNNIVNEKKRKNFANLYDLIDRCSLGEKEVYNLVKCGALRSIESSEPNLIFKTKVYFKNKKNKEITRVLTENINFQPYSLTQRIINEIEILKFAVSGHPLDIFPCIEKDNTITPSNLLNKKSGERVKVVGWVITGRRASTKNGDFMRFMTIEDKKGLMECVLFPKVYQEYGAILKSCGPFTIIGTVQSRVKGEANIIVEKIKTIENIPISSSKLLPICHLNYSYYVI